MKDRIVFSLNGQDVEAEPGETIWQVADRLGVEIPHLCWQPEPGDRADIVLVKARSPAEALTTLCPDRIVIRDGRIVAESRLQQFDAPDSQPTKETPK